MKNFGKSLKKFSLIFLCLILAVFCFSSFAFADSIDLDKDVNVTLQFKDKTVLIPDTQFYFYKIGDIDVAGNFALYDEFKNYPVNIGSTNGNWPDAAATLVPYVKRDHLTPTYSGKTDAFGILELTVSSGLYLIYSERSPLVTETNNYYTAIPFLSILPERATSTEWSYDVPMYPKSEKLALSTIGRTSFKVLKIWDDTDYEAKRPAAVEIQLLKNGEIYDTVSLSEDNSWSYVWQSLDNSCTWDVVETEMADYTVTVKSVDNTFTVTNQYSGTDDDTAVLSNSDSDDSASDDAATQKAKLPQTGVLLWPIPVLFSLGLILIIIGLLLKDKKLKNK